jgi:poly-gamma-glutamate synthesis protein (capsule biosynthesis protein)
LREKIGALNLSSDVALSLDVSSATDVYPNKVQFQWVYVLVAPFATIRDGVTSAELRGVWSNGASSALFNGQPLLMAESTRSALKSIWGEPANGSVRSVDEDQISDTAWNESAWVIIPFEDLTPRWKVLTIDGQSPIRKGFDASNYPLIVSFTLQTSSPLTAPVATSNYDSTKLTTVIITGTTALVRATAFKMEQKGVTYPGEDVRDIMRAADITHVSNEVSFFDECPPADPNSTLLIFCSDPKYIGLLTDVGVDVVELTGNHFADYGRKAMEQTLAMYKSNDMKYFGGGSNYQDAFQPALFEVNGNKIAFLGCNLPDMGTADIATDDGPGSARCDFDYFTSKVGELKAQGYLVIFTFQWFEDYTPPPEPQMVTDFHRIVDAGATIVSGSQAHFPKTMEFYNDAFIHYGLGNLFFDQMGNLSWMPEGIRREFLDRYVIYDGKLISVELITTLLEDFARPRIMNQQERSDFLQEYFADSGWTPILDGSISSPTTVP